MIRLRLETPGRPLRVLFLGAHPDDIEIGCGGTVLELARSTEIDAQWVVFTGAGSNREAEAKSGAAQFLEAVHEKTVHIEAFRDGHLPFQGTEVKEYFERKLKPIEPDIIFTHYRSDRHQDHRVISDLTWNTFRNHLILEYEVPKYDGDLGCPNYFVPLEPTTCEQKVDAVMDVFTTQADRHWFTPDLFRAMMRIRGVESASPTGLAEAFHCRKGLLGL